MKTILIVDSGSSKSLWALVEGTQVALIETEGLNPYYHSEEKIQEVIESIIKPKINKPVDACYFYGAGCAHARYSGKIKRSIKKKLDIHQVNVDGDLLGAARAACQQEAGIIAIMGTGSISGYYDGEHIMEKVPALGYVLGDEGSGTYLGKLFLKRYLRGDFSSELMDKLKAMHITEHGVIENVYTRSLPNRYLAEFAQKIAPLKEDPEIQMLLEDGFSDFFDQHVERYDQSEELYLIGSVAWGFRNALVKVAENYGVTIKKILKDPIEGLINYHV